MFATVLTIVSAWLFSSALFSGGPVLETVSLPAPYHFLFERTTLLEFGSQFDLLCHIPCCQHWFISLTLLVYQASLQYSLLLPFATTQSEKKICLCFDIFVLWMGIFFSLLSVMILTPKTRWFHFLKYDNRSTPVTLVRLVRKMICFPIISSVFDEDSAFFSPI